MAVGKGYKGNTNISRITNNAKVTDHHAILPTMEIAKTDLSELPLGERKVLTLISVRLLGATAQPNIYEMTTAKLKCADNIFTANGKMEIKAGWKEVERLFFAQLKQKTEKEDPALPKLIKGQRFDNVKSSVREGKTTPPKRYTEDTLLSAMETAGAEETPDDAERKGLGTPATRAAILEKIVSGGFAERKKKLLIPTKKGINLITVLPDNIKSPLLTAEWESKLKQVERGELSVDGFMKGITDMVRELVRTHDRPDRDYISLFPNKYDEGEVIGVCPRCGFAVREGTKGFFCENRACSFVLWKENNFFAEKKKTVTKQIAAALLKDGRIYVKDLYSAKKNKIYGAFILLDDTGGKYVNFKLEFPQRKDRSPRKGGRK